MKKVLYIFTIFICFFTFNTVKAKQINKISMDIYIDSNGNAHITETWDANIKQGTEGYRSYDNMGEAYITDYKVSMDNREFKNKDYWNINGSLSDKANYYGINNNGDKKELCFGITNYGRHTYRLSYTINGFVASTTNSDMIYWELLPNELAKQTDKAYIKIYSDLRYNDTLPVWGYGNYGGYAYVYDGYIEMSNDSLSSNDYMTILVKFDKGTFNTSNVLDNNFDYYYNMAENGAKHYKKSFGEKFIAFLSIIINVMVWVIIVICACAFSKNKSNKSGSKTLDFGKKGKKISNDINLFRELPCGKDIYRTYWLSYNYGLMKKQTDFLGAILLKWVKEEKIGIENKTVGKLFKKEDTTIIFNKDKNFDVELEQTLYNYMYEASKDGILESKEFEKWCSSHYSKILNWFDKVLDYENNILINEGKLLATERVTLKIFKDTVYTVNESIYDEAVKVKGLKLFFKEFENMKDKEAIDVRLWEEYLMYAQILGVADKVAKQFKKLYPDVITDQTYNSYIFVNSISHSGMSSASSARSRAQSYSSGGGGFSSGGGGGGSFGGGGGGGFR